jgi:hypothetical protein
MKTFLFTILFLICLFITSQHVIDAQGNVQDIDLADIVYDPFLKSDARATNAETQNANRAQNVNAVDANIGVIDDAECHQTVEDIKPEHDGSLFLNRQDQDYDTVPPVQEPQQITKDYLSGNVEVCAEAKDNIGAASDSEYHQTIEDIKHEHDGSLFLNHQEESVPAHEHPKLKRDYMGADRVNKAVQDQRPIHDVPAEQPNPEIIRNTMKNTAGGIPNVADIL